ncbi:hypothetical protein BRD18_04225 [Halobacteriales archaeon SW_7_71_33]|nr:MAG: hypothetical protein BRD18_04225 [Halobacteriales archaeon SW_7_71_33]
MTDPAEALRGTLAANPVADPEAWADRLAVGDILTEQQARVLVHKHGRGLTDREVADEVGLSAGAVGDYRRTAEQKLRDAEETLAITEELRRTIRPDARTDSRSDPDTDSTLVSGAYCLNCETLHVPVPERACPDCGSQDLVVGTAGVETDGD